MDLVTVRWFLRVAETGNVTRAAEELRISQPGLSRAIARLQHDLRAPLFDREGRTLRLNAYGAIFREHAKRLVASRRRSPASARPGRRPRARRGWPGPFYTRRAPRWCRNCSARTGPRHPGWTFRLTAGQRRSHRGAESSRGTRTWRSPAPPPEGLAWHLLTTERLKLAVPVDHRLAARGAGEQGEVSLTEVADEPFIRPETQVRLALDHREPVSRGRYPPEDRLRGRRDKDVARSGRGRAGRGGGPTGRRGSGGRRTRDRGRTTKDRPGMGRGSHPPTVVENFRHFVLAHAAEYGAEERGNPLR